jgi:hypothetical protein
MAIPFSSRNPMISHIVTVRYLAQSSHSESIISVVTNISFRPGAEIEVTVRGNEFANSRKLGIGTNIRYSNAYLERNMDLQ